jgi:hypothetical protein
MKADDAQSAATKECGRPTQHVNALPEHFAKLLEFSIDMDPDRLERACSRVDLLAMERHGVGNDFRQLDGTSDRRLVARRYDRSRYSRSKALFTVGLEDSSQFLFIHCCEPLGGTDARVRIHSHVERSVTEEAETTACFVQLWR